MLVPAMSRPITKVAPMSSEIIFLPGTFMRVSESWLAQAIKITLEISKNPSSDGFFLFAR